MVGVQNVTFVPTIQWMTHHTITNYKIVLATPDHKSKAKIAAQFTIIDAQPQFTILDTQPTLQQPIFSIISLNVRVGMKCWLKFLWLSFECVMDMWKRCYILSCVFLEGCYVKKLAECLKFCWEIMLTICLPSVWWNVLVWFFVVFSWVLFVNLLHGNKIGAAASQPSWEVGVIL